MAKSKKVAPTLAPKKRPVKAKRGDGHGSRRKSAAKDVVAQQTVAKKGTKIASITVLLCRTKGVSLGELCKHTGWQPHSVRAVISSVIKKKLGLDVVSERVGDSRIYRVIV